MRYVESAENMTYDIPGKDLYLKKVVWRRDLLVLVLISHLTPYIFVVVHFPPTLGFREKHNYFPDTIYYTGTPQRVREYQKKTREMEADSAPAVLNFEGDDQQLLESNAAAASATAVATATLVVRTAVEEEKKDVVQRNGVQTMDEGLVQLMTTKLQSQFDSERATSQKQIGELQQQLRDQQELMREQQQTLRDQQQVLMQILDKLDR